MKSKLRIDSSEDEEAKSESKSASNLSLKYKQDMKELKQKELEMFKVMDSIKRISDRARTHLEKAKSSRKQAVAGQSTLLNESTLKKNKKKGDVNLQSKVESYLEEIDRYNDEHNERDVLNPQNEKDSSGEVSNMSQIPYIDSAPDNNGSGSGGTSG